MEIQLLLKSWLKKVQQLLVVFKLFQIKSLKTKHSLVFCYNLLCNDFSLNIEIGLKNSFTVKGKGEDKIIRYYNLLICK